jgi:TRAP-type transport system periplasmic protein
MKKKIVALTVMAALVIWGPLATAQDQITLKAYDSLYEGGGAYKAGWDFLVNAVSDRTQGKMKIQMFGKETGDEQAAVQGLNLGTFDMYLGGYSGHPQYDNFYLPYLFRDTDHLWKVLNGPLGLSLGDRMLKDRGIRQLGFWYFEPRQLTSNKKIETATDVKGLKIRVPQIRPLVDTWKALGANPSPISFNEVYMALKQGVIEAQENPLDLIRSQKFYEVQKYLIMTNHARPLRMGLMNNATWEKLTPDSQRVLVQAWKEANAMVQKQLQSNETQLIEFLKSQGTTVITPDLSTFKAATKDVYKAYLPNTWGADAYDMIQNTN